MKTIFRIFSFAALVSFAAMSCTKENVDFKSGKMTLKLGITQDETKLVYHENQVEWASADRIIVFDTEGGKCVSEQAGSSATYSLSHEFECTDWDSSKTPAYALFNFSASGTPYADAAVSGGKISAYVSNNQIVNNSGSFAQYGPVSVGVVTGTENPFKASLKNVCGMLRFNMSNCSDVVSVTLSSVENVDLAGKIEISTSSVEAGTPDYTVVEGAGSITLSAVGGAATDGCLRTSSSVFYMISILPGVEFTPVLTFKNKDGKICKRTATKSITVHRNEIVNLKTIDANLTFADPVLPDSFVVDLNFYNDGNVNPLGTFATTADQNAADGETYNYSLQYNDGAVPMTAELPFVICKGSTDGAYYKFTTHSNGTYESGTATHILYFTQSGGWIKLPAVEGHYLKSVSVTIGNTSGKSWTLMDGPGIGNVLYSSGTYAATSDALKTKSVSFNSASDPATTENTAYYIYLNSCVKLNVYDIRLEYSTTLKEEFVVGFTSTSSNPFSGIESSGTTAVTDDEFTLDGYTFKSLGNAGFSWSSGLWNRANSNGYLQLPTVSGYKLTKVYLMGGNSPAKYFKFRYSDDSKSYSDVPGGETLYLGSSMKGAGTGENADNAKLDNTWVFSDTYYASRCYYLFCGASSSKVTAMQLTYTPVEFL